MTVVRGPANSMNTTDAGNETSAVAVKLCESRLRMRNISPAAAASDTAGTRLVASEDVITVGNTSSGIAMPLYSPYMLVAWLVTKPAACNARMTSTGSAANKSDQINLLNVTGSEIWLIACTVFRIDSAARV